MTLCNACNVCPSQKCETPETDVRCCGECTTEYCNHATHECCTEPLVQHHPACYTCGYYDTHLNVSSG